MMATVEHSWQHQTQQLLKLLNTPSSSEFKQTFKTKITHAFKAHQTFTATLSDSKDIEPYQKAFIHTFQLYDQHSFLQLVQHYDPQHYTETRVAKLIQKTLSSLNMTYLLNQDLNPEHQQQLRRYQSSLKHFLSYWLASPISEVEQLAKTGAQAKQIQLPLHIEAQYKFSDALTDLLSSHEYQIYLILRNTCLAQNILRLSEHKPIKAWLLKQLTHYGAPKRSHLKNKLTHLDFRQVENLLSLLHQEFAHQKNYQKHFRSLNPLKPLLEKQQHLQTPKKVVPSSPPSFHRSAFEKLCFRFSKEILQLSKYTQLIPHSSSPYLFAKNEDYLLKVQEEFQTFFGGQKETLDSYTHFVSELLQLIRNLTQQEGSIEQSCTYAKDSRHRKIEGLEIPAQEWGLIFKSRLPFPVHIKDPSYMQKVEKGHPFIIHIGLSFFDHDLSKVKQVKNLPTGYFKVLLKGAKLRSQSSVTHIGQEPFFLLRPNQQEELYPLVLLYLIAIRSKFSLEFSDALKHHMVQTLK